MALALTSMVLVLVSNIVLGTALVLGVFSLMERNVALGAAGGLVVGIVVIYAESQVGEAMFDLTFGETRLLVIIAAIGAVVGIVGSVLAVKPEL